MLAYFLNVSSLQGLKKDIIEHKGSFEDSAWKLVEEHNYSPHNPQSTADMASITEQLTAVKIKVFDLLHKIDGIEEIKKRHLDKAISYTSNNGKLMDSLSEPSTIKDVEEPIVEDVSAIKDELSQLESVQDTIQDVVRPSLHAIEDSGKWIIEKASNE